MKLCSSTRNSIGSNEDKVNKSSAQTLNDTKMCSTFILALGHREKGDTLELR
jgi:hypothetical protein